MEGDGVCVCVSVRQEITCLLLFDKEWEWMILGIIMFVFFCVYKIAELAGLYFRWKTTDLKNLGGNWVRKAPTAMQPWFVLTIPCFLFLILFTRRCIMSSTFASAPQFFITYCYWEIFRAVLIAWGHCLLQTALVSIFFHQKTLPL